MATETVSLSLDETWALVSNAGTGGFLGVAGAGAVIWYVGSSAPPASRRHGIDQKVLSFAALPDKVWARVVSGVGSISATRTVDAANVTEAPFIPSPAGTLSATSFAADAMEGSTIATITPALAGSKAVQLYPTNSGLRIAPNGLSLIKTGTRTPPGTLNLTIIFDHPQATNTPRGLDVALTVTSPIVSGPTLGALTLSAFTGTVGSAFSATISGRTSGSTLSLSGAGAAGLSISGLTISGTPTTAGPINVIETLSGAVNTPRTSPTLATIAASGGGTAPDLSDIRLLAGRSGSFVTLPLSVLK